MMRMLDYLVAGMVGLAVGSFLNVVITRLPQGEAFGWGRSRCPQCRFQLPWYDTIPLFSYIFLHGRCRWCGAAISRRYPGVELAGALLALALWFTFPFSPLLFAYTPFGMALIALSAIDLEQGLLPDAITLPGIGLGLLLSLIIPDLSFPSALAGALVGAAIFQGIAWSYAKWSGKQGMGGGDVKLLALIGAFLGLESLPWVIFGSAALGTLAGMITVLVRGQRQEGGWRTLPIPYGPFLAAGALIYLFGHTYLQRFLEIGGPY
jgi:leader peptidase (prepilin peptidase) / N-methyltransferase